MMKINKCKSNFRTMVMALALTYGVCDAMPLMAGGTSVVTNKVWLSGATHIYGRMSVTGVSSVSEQGFCYSETNKMPTVDDNTSKSYISNNGYIYNISGLTPSTVYYIRAYVKTKSGDVIYGNPVKAITRPVGGVSYGIRDGFPSDALTRIQSAAKEAIGLWNEYTGIHGLYVNIGYGADTPTADCSYGGWMRVGPNSSYQKTGTLLHEMLHAIGVGTISTWSNNSFLRSNTTSGYWLGTRVTRALRFWDNSTTEQLNGDATHMWPYGVNGAHEDNGTQLLYVGNSLLAEALGEDGLAPTSSQFATPAYTFEQDDDTKYYLKNEEYGSASKFLRIDKTGNLAWTTMTANQAEDNDSAAWNVSFDPVTCYYSLKNVATGKYMSYSTSGNNGIKLVEASGELTTKEKFHFLPSPVEVATINDEAKTGYWIAYVENNNPICLSAQDNKEALTAQSFSFTQAAGNQRWMLLTADEVEQYENSLKNDARAAVTDIVVKCESLYNTPHKETADDADATFLDVLTQAKAKIETAEIAELETMIETLYDAVRTFISKTAVTSADKLYDISFFLQNPDMDDIEGWTIGTTSSEPTINYSCAEYYEKNIDLSQKLANMPIGKYELRVQAFQRPGATATVATNYAAGKDNVTVYIYMGTTNNKTNICNIMQDAQSKKLGVGTETSANGKYVPNNMQAASNYFAQGLYENAIQYTRKYKGALTLGISGTNVTGNYWTIFDNFRLYSYGKEDATGISEVNSETTAKYQKGIFTISGQKVSANAEDLKNLPAGIWIVDGKKVMVK